MATQLLGAVVALPQRYLTSLILGFAAKYIRDVNESELQVGLWSGEVTLKDLDLNTERLQREMNWPVELRRIFVAELTIRVPWQALRTEVIKVRVEGVEVEFGPARSPRAAAASSRGVADDVAIEDGQESWVAAMLAPALANIEFVVGDVLVLAFIDDEEEEEGADGEEEGADGEEEGADGEEEDDEEDGKGGGGAEAPYEYDARAIEVRIGGFRSYSADRQWRDAHIDPWQQGEGGAPLHRIVEFRELSIRVGSELLIERLGLDMRLEFLPEAATTMEMRPHDGEALTLHVSNGAAGLLAEWQQWSLCYFAEAEDLELSQTISPDVAAREQEAADAAGSGSVLFTALFGGGAPPPAADGEAAAAEPAADSGWVSWVWGGGEEDSDAQSPGPAQKAVVEVGGQAAEEDPNPLASSWLSTSSLRSAPTISDDGMRISFFLPAMEVRLQLVERLGEELHRGPWAVAKTQGFTMITEPWHSDGELHATLSFQAVEVHSVDDMRVVFSCGELSSAGAAQPPSKFLSSCSLFKPPAIPDDPEFIAVSTPSKGSGMGAGPAAKDEPAMELQMLGAELTVLSNDQTLRYSVPFLADAMEFWATCGPTRANEVATDASEAIFLTQRTRIIELEAQLEAMQTSAAPAVAAVNPHLP